MGLDATDPVFTALNKGGEVHYVQTHYLDPGEGPKYDNPAASLGHNPRLAWTRAVGTPVGDRLIVCEGIPDALTASAHRHQAVVILGSRSPDDAVAMATRRRGRRIDVRSNPPGPGMDLNSWRLDQQPESVAVDGAIELAPTVDAVR